MEIAQCAAKFFALGLARRTQQCLDQVDKIAMWKWFLQKVNRTQSSRLLTLIGQMHGGKNDGAGVRMTRAQVVEEFLSKIVGGIDIENEKIGLAPEDEVLRFLQAVGQIHLRGRRRFVQCAQNIRGQFFIRLQHQEPAFFAIRIFRNLFLVHVSS